MKAALLALLVLFGMAVAQDGAAPESAKPGEAEREWLRQFVGEWTITSNTGETPPGMEGSFKSEERIRAVGSLWTYNEADAQFGAMKFQSMMTLGYDPVREAFVGTYVDTIQTHLWIYEGQLDEEKRVLTMNCEGPSMTDPRVMGQYRDQFELIGPDHKRMTSSYQDKDGEWVTIMVSEGKRKE